MENNLLTNVMETNDLTFNVQAALDFTLIGTKLKMAFSKIGSENAFVVLPAQLQDTQGMTIKEMVDAINQFGKDYDPEMSSDLTADKVQGAVSDVSSAAAKKNAEQTDADVEAMVNAIDFDKIKIKLTQAFLVLMTGHQMEYALEIDVLLDGVFPAQTFINVDKLSLAVWNTQRAKILSTMNIVDVEKLLEDTK